jgi:hypothetical protein
VTDWKKIEETDDTITCENTDPDPVFGEKQIKIPREIYEEINTAGFDRGARIVLLTLQTNLDSIRDALFPKKKGRTKEAE